MIRPYVGLRPFRSDEQPLFFGRGSDLRALRNLVETLPSVVVYATSGTGKSSLLNAGLVAEIEQERRDTARGSRAGERQTVAVSISDPAADLRATVQTALAIPADLDLTLEGLLDWHWRERRERVVLIVDQFEERLKRDADSTTLWNDLAPLANGDGRSACVVISIRDDYLAGLEPLLTRVPGLLDASLRVPNLSEAGYREAARRPLEVVGDGTTVSDALIDEMLADLRAELRASEGWANHVEPGYFQLVCDHLWSHAVANGHDELSAETYRAAGGAAGIIKEFVRDAIDHLLPFEQEMLHATIRYLILPTGAKVALTTDDLLGLARNEDFTVMAGLTPLISEAAPNRRRLRDFGASDSMRQLDHDVCREVLGGLFETMTTSDSPIFRRVRRGTRTEFELVHDLLGFVLLEWRSEYGRTQDATLKRWIDETNRLGSRSAAKDLTPSEVAATLRQVEHDFGAFGADLGAVPEVGPDQVTAAVTWLLSALHIRRVVVGLRYATRSDRRRRSERRDAHDLVAELDPLQGAMRGLHEAAMATATAAIGPPHPQAERRASQLALPGLLMIGEEVEADYRPRPRTTPNIRGLIRVVSIFVAQVAAAVITVFGTARVVETALSPPTIEYLPLSLGLLAVITATVYVGVVFSSREISWRTMLTGRFLVPYIDRTTYSGDPVRKTFLFWTRIGSIWLTPVVLVLVPAYGGAWLFDARGSSATAGFDLVGLIAVVPAVAAYVVSWETAEMHRTSLRAANDKPDEEAEGAAIHEGEDATSPAGSPPEPSEA